MIVLPDTGIPDEEQVMNDAAMTKEQWVEVLEAAGIDQEGRERWHRAFEVKYPEGHQGFLQWLRLPEAEIERIREWSRG
jgi:hypothetical protein